MAKCTHPQMRTFDARRLVYYRLASPDGPSIFMLGTQLPLSMVFYSGIQTQVHQYDNLPDLNLRYASSVT